MHSVNKVRNEQSEPCEEQAVIREVQCLFDAEQREGCRVRGAEQREGCRVSSQQREQRICLKLERPKLPCTFAL